MRKLIIIILALAFLCCAKKNTGKPDTNPPSISIINPENGENVCSNVEIVISANDESRIEQVKIFGNETNIASLPSPPWHYTWDISQYPNGTRIRIFASATDEYGNTGYSDTITLSVLCPDSSRQINLIADSIGTRFARLRWNMFTGEGFLRYILAYSTESGVDTTDIIAARIQTVSETTYTVSGLTPATTYYFRLFVLKSDATLISTNEVQITTAEEETRDDGAEMVLVPAGAFIMGDSWGDGASDEFPAHSVNLPSFWIDKYEVTNRLFARFIEEGGYNNPEFWSQEGWAWKERNHISAPLYWNTGQYSSGTDYPDYPVVGVSYYEAEAYARFAGKELPSEAMWEKCARGSMNPGYKWPWGNEFHKDISGVRVHCNYNGNDGYEDPYPQLAPVGAFPTGASPYGAMDMAGNVAEWTKDWYSASYYRESSQDNPQGPSSGTEKTVRGASWVNSSTTSSPGYTFRNPARLHKDPTERKHYIGFRCARIAK